MITFYTGVTVKPKTFHQIKKLANKKLRIKTKKDLGEYR